MVKLIGIKQLKEKLILNNMEEKKQCPGPSVQVQVNKKVVVDTSEEEKEDK